MDETVNNIKMKKFSKASRVARIIKERLVKKFPNVNFKVRSAVFDDGDSIRITWYDGPSIPKVEAVYAKYQYGHYDYETNTYIKSNVRAGIQQVKTITTGRLMSGTTEEMILKQLQARYPNDCAGIDRDGFVDRFNASMRQLIWREFYDMDISN